MVVKKYGGSSLATTTLIKEVAKHLKEERKKNEKTVIVVSAMGKTTNNLISLANEISKTPKKRELDALISNGENVSSALLAMALNDIGVKAISLNGFQTQIITEGSFSKGYISSININIIINYLKYGYMVIVTGFQGINKNNDIQTLGRGGSDTTAVALACKLKCRCEIYTDVEHIFTCDPRILQNPKPIKILSYNEMIELSLGGAKVLEPRSVELAKKYNIPIYLGKSLKSPNLGGSHILKTKLEEEHVSSLAIKENIASISIKLNSNSKHLIDSILKLNKQSLNNFDMLSITSIENSQFLSFCIEDNKSDEFLKLLETTSLIKKILSIEVQKLSKIVVAGIGFITHPDLVTNVIETLKSINIHNLALSEFALTITVEKDKSLKTLELLQDKFNL